MLARLVLMRSAPIVSYLNKNRMILHVEVFAFETKMFWGAR